MLSYRCQQGNDVHDSNTGTKTNTSNGVVIGEKQDENHARKGTYNSRAGRNNV